jgi:hypothetical protein
VLPLLQGAKVDWPNRNIVIQSHRGNQPWRYHHFMITDGRWKLMHASGFHKERFAGEPKFELYDLQNDPGEKNNLVDARRTEFVRLRKDYDRWFDDVSSTREDNYAPPRIVIGSDKEIQTVLTRQDWRAENWADNAIGFWKIRVAEPGVFKVTMLLTGKRNVSQVVVEARKPVTRSVSMLTAKIVVDNIRLEKGDLDFRCMIETNGKNIGPHQVIVERIDARK